MTTKKNVFTKGLHLRFLLLVPPAGLPRSIREPNLLHFAIPSTRSFHGSSAVLPQTQVFVHVPGVSESKSK